MNTTEPRTGYQVPPKPRDPKARLVRITDAAEIESIRRSGIKDIIGTVTADGEAWGEVHSVNQYRGVPVEFPV